MSLADEFLLDAIQAERAADRARIRYVREVREALVRGDAAVPVPAALSRSARARSLLRLRLPRRRSAERTTG